MTDEDYEFNRIERESKMRMQAVQAAMPEEVDMSKEAMKLALEALQEVYWSSRSAKHDEAITAIKQALAAQPAPTVQEPVAWVTDLEFDFDTELIPARRKGKLGTADMTIPLYTTPPAAQPAPVQEPVAWTLLLVGEHHGIIGKAGDRFLGHPEHYQRVDVYTTPPAAQPAIPDALTSADIQEHIEYVAGWNDCRQAMMEMMK